MIKNIAFFALFLLAAPIRGEESVKRSEKPAILYTHIYKSPLIGDYNEILFVNQAFEDIKDPKKLAVTEELSISADDYGKLTTLSTRRPSQNRDKAILALASCKKILDTLKRKDLPEDFVLKINLPNNQSAAIYRYVYTISITTTHKDRHGVTTGTTVEKIPSTTYEIYQQSNVQPIAIINLIKTIAAPEPTDFFKYITNPKAVSLTIAGAITLYWIISSSKAHKKGP